MDIPSLNYVDKLAGDDKAFRNTFLGILKDEFPEEKELFFNFYTNKKYQDAAEIVHKLKHKFNILGMESAYKLAVTYEKELLENNTESTTSFKAVLVVVENFIKSIEL